MQVCQFILDEYIHTMKGAHCNIICTQPRKVSAISIAKRVAYERAEDLGKSVGYTVRFDGINPRYFGAILFCTTGKFFNDYIFTEEINLFIYF